MAKLTIAKGELELGSTQLGELREATALRNDRTAMQERLQQDGYLFIRGFHDPERVKAARRVVLENLRGNEQLDAHAPLEEGRAAPGKNGAFMGGKKACTHTPEFLALVESPAVMNFFSFLLDGPIRTYDYKWLRAVAPGASTGAHYDVVYMGRGTLNVYTVWTPLGDVPLDLGPLAILYGSHRLEKVKETYGQMDVDRDKVGGWFSDDPQELLDKYGGQWQTAEFRAGDALIFGMFTMHGSVANQTDRFRISTDTRYQRADEPVDERWIGDDPMAHYAWHEGENIPMEEMRRRWGV